MSDSPPRADLDGGGGGSDPDLTESGLLSERVESAFADAKGVDPDESDTQLYRQVDLEGINRLHRHFQEHHGAFWSIEFSIEDYDVVVRADGTVSVQ